MAVEYSPWGIFNQGACRLLSAYNPNVFRAYSSIGDPDNEGGCTVVISGDNFSYEFEAIYYKTDGNGYNYKLDCTNIFPALLNKLDLKNDLSSTGEAFLTNWEALNSDDDQIFVNVNVKWTFYEDGELSVIDDEDFVVCRSVNQFGDEGGNALWSIWSKDSRPKYYLWDGVTCPVGIYFKDVTAVDIVGSISIDAFAELIGYTENYDSGLYNLRMNPNINYFPNRVDNGDFEFFTNYPSYTLGDIPDGWEVDLDTWDGEDVGFIDNGDSIVMADYLGYGVGIYQNILNTGEDYILEIDIDYIELDGGVKVFTMPDEVELDILTNTGVNLLEFTSSDTAEELHIETVQNSYGYSEVVLNSVSLKLKDTHATKKRCSMSFDDDGERRYADLVVRESCEDEITVRFLSRDYAIRSWRFSHNYTESTSYSELGRVKANIMNMNEHAKLTQVIGFDSQKSISCVFKGADLDEQALLMQLFTSPYVEILINDVWVGCTATGSHTINSKMPCQDFNVTFVLPEEFNQKL